MTIKKPQVWIIRHKETKEQWEARSGKASWRAVNHAKAAWALSNENKFDEQSDYEVFNLYNYAELEKQLDILFGIISDIEDAEGTTYMTTWESQLKEVGYEL